MGWIKYQRTQALGLIEALISDHREVELSVGNRSTIRIRPVRREMLQQDYLVDLGEHCARLSELIGQLCCPEGLRATELQQHELLDPRSAAEWLHVASSIDTVEVDTSRYDPTVMYCDSAADYEAHQGNVLSEFATQLTIFAFVWGSLETVTKAIRSPKIPRSVMAGSSLVDEAILYLKTQYEPMPAPFLYDEVVADLRQALGNISYYNDLSDEFRTRSSMGTTGIGLHVVRRIRNRFAHGTMKLPGSEAVGNAAISDGEVIRLSIRITLLSTQMLLAAFLKDKRVHLDFDSIYDEPGRPQPESTTDVLQTLHVRFPDLNEDQYPLFL